MAAAEITNALQNTLVIVGLKQQQWQNALSELCLIYDQLAQIYEFATPDAWELGGAQVVVNNRIADKKYILTLEKPLMVFIKKDIAVETARNIICFNTDAVGSAWYTVAVEDYTKIIVLKDA